MGRKRILVPLGSDGVTTSFLFSDSLDHFRVAKADLVCKDQKEGARQTFTWAEYERLKREKKLPPRLRLSTPYELRLIARMVKKFGMAPSGGTTPEGAILPDRKRYMSDDHSVCLEIRCSADGELNIRLVRINPELYQKLYIRLVSST